MPEVSWTQDMHYLLAKVSKLEEVVPGLLHPVRPPVPEPMGLTKQYGLIAPGSRPVPRRKVFQCLNLYKTSASSHVLFHHM